MTDQASNRSTDQATDNAGIQFPPPFIYIIPLVLGILAEHWWPLVILPVWLRMVLGGLSLAISLGILITGAYELRRNKTAIVPHDPATVLVESGIYSRTRNPLYLGLIFFYLGFAFLFSSLWAIILLPDVIFVIQRFVIAKEEAYLERRFGEAYLEYKQRVGRWF
ncbi:MAG: isoprenylcysteine carboxylmethyltransferase family protein [Candidatus Kapaibacterium sp.]|jgi:protein-S-isoprenylcysteine O-methyltransferase Ste14